MYIGPWQEYNLSKARTYAGLGFGTNAAAASQFAPDLAVRAQIEKALLSSLDPESARRAMEAMNPILSGGTATVGNYNSNSNNSSMKLPPTLQNGQLNVSLRQQQQQPHRNAPRGGNRRGIRRYRLPPVDSSGSKTISRMNSARNSMREASPLSVRSTQSEPIKGSHSQLSPYHPNNSKHVHQYPEQQQQQQHQYQQQQQRMHSKALTGTKSVHVQLPQLHRISGSTATAAATLLPAATEFRASGEYPLGIAAVPERQPAYNTPAMLNLLRLERSDRTKAELARVTGWTMRVDMDNDKYDDAVYNSSNTMNPLEKKVEKVNIMKKLYMTQHLEEKLAADAISSNSNSNNSNNDVIVGRGSPLVGTLPPLSPNLKSADSPTARAGSRSRGGGYISTNNNNNSNASYRKSFHGSSNINSHSSHLDNVAGAVPFTANAAATGDVGGVHQNVDNNVDLTDAEFNKVLKYFRSSIGPIDELTNSGSGQDSAVGAILATRQRQEQQQISISSGNTNSSSNSSSSKGMQLGSSKHHQLRGEAVAREGATERSASFNIVPAMGDELVVADMSDSDQRYHDTELIGIKRSPGRSAHQLMIHSSATDGLDVVSAMPSPSAATGPYVELHLGGLEGLLKWSSSLDVDMI